MVETLGQFIKRRREELGLTQDQLAAKAGVKMNSIKNWEYDLREPLLSAAHKLAAALGVPMERLAACSLPTGKKNSRIGGTKKPRTRPPSKK